MGRFQYRLDDKGRLHSGEVGRRYDRFQRCDDQYGITTFDAPGAVFGTFAHSINSDGSVAGYYSDQDGFPRGFVRDKYGNFTTIDTAGHFYPARSGASWWTSTISVW
jgi:hypothetical protein